MEEVGIETQQGLDEGIAQKMDDGGEVLGNADDAAEAAAVQLNHGDPSSVAAASAPHQVQALMMGKMCKVEDCSAAKGSETALELRVVELWTEEMRTVKTRAG